VTVWEAAAILLAGVGAGTINAVVGSGTLITFPTLLALGYPAVSANVSNNIGLVFGSLSATWGYRQELSGQGRTLRRLTPASLIGSVIGAVLLLRLPAKAFETIVPVLIGIAIVLVLVQPRIAAAAAARRDRAGREHTGAGPLALIGTGLAGVYGGYFGAAQGVLLIGLLGALLPENLQRVNAVKNWLAAVANGVAAVTFLIVAPGQVRWWVAALIAVGSTLGGMLGSRIGRRLPPVALRVVIVVVGLTAVVRLLASR
jgi:uncharacterized membrane protein YfcA